MDDKNSLTSSAREATAPVGARPQRWRRRGRYALGPGGNDQYVVRNSATVIAEGAGQGTGDRVAAAVNFTLGAGDKVEALTTTSAGGTAALNLTGNEISQAGTGNAGPTG